MMIGLTEQLNPDPQVMLVTLPPPIPAPMLVRKSAALGMSAPFCDFCNQSVVPPISCACTPKAHRKIASAALKREYRSIGSPNL